MKSKAAPGNYPIHPILAPIPIGVVGGKLACEHRIGVVERPTDVSRPAAPERAAS